MGEGWTSENYTFSGVQITVKAIGNKQVFDAEGHTRLSDLLLLKLMAEGIFIDKLDSSRLS